MRRAKPTIWAYDSVMVRVKRLPVMEMLQPGLSPEGVWSMKEGNGKVTCVMVLALIVVSSSIGMGLMGGPGIHQEAMGGQRLEKLDMEPKAPAVQQAPVDDADQRSMPEYVGTPGTDWPIGETLSPLKTVPGAPTKATPIDGRVPVEHVQGPRQSSEPKVDEPAPVPPTVEEPETTGEATVVPSEEDEEGPVVPSPPSNRGSNLPALSELRRLSSLEGLKDFARTDDIEKDYRGPGGIGQGEGQANGVADEAEPEREIEESDLVKLDGDTLYVLNPYRGLIVVDLKDPDHPVILGNAPVIGRPVEMYVVGDRAFIIVSCDYGFWYGFSRASSWWDWYWPRYQIGSRLVIMDLADPADPTILKEYPIEGLVSDSRRVGDVLYYVATCDSWYNHYTEARMLDLTYVLSVDIADPLRISMVDTISFSGNSYVIHVTTDNLYVCQYEHNTKQRYGTSTFTLVDISDPLGSIHERDRFGVAGYVGDRYQMDEYAGTFRVVSHYRDGRVQESELFIFDITDVSDVGLLGRLLIKDAGSLMATRFAGDRGYTIHLPRSVDPLDVMDLSDPTAPVMCDVFQMPGWVTHMEVRGDKIIALGVDDSDGSRNVAVSLFDVTDPWNVVMEDRVRIGGSHGYSSANWDPKALTVLDDQGLVLVPFYSHTHPNGYCEIRNGVQIVSFDLARGDLQLQGSFDQPGTVIRTRSLGQRVLSTSCSYLVVADATDLMAPEVTAVIELYSDVLDYRGFDGQYVEIVRSISEWNIHLRVFAKGSNDLNPPIFEVDLESNGYVERWFWQGGLLHVLVWEDDDNEMHATIRTYRVHPCAPTLLTSTTIDAGDTLCHWQIRSWYEGGNYWNYDWKPVINSAYEGLDNPVILDGWILALYMGSRLYFVDLDVDDDLLGGVSRAASSVAVACDEGFNGMLAAGRSLYLVNSAWRTLTFPDEHPFSVCEYTLTPVDLAEGHQTSVGDPFKVPGRPVGASSDGARVYTTSEWYIDGPDDKRVTLNVLDVSAEEAEIVCAFDIKDKACKVFDDTAVITEVMPVHLVDPNLPGIVIPERTVVYVVDLAACQPTTAYVLLGDQSLFYAHDGIAMLQDASCTQLTIVDLERPDGMPVLTIARLDALMSIGRDGDTLYLVEGPYGCVAVDLRGE